MAGNSSDQAPLLPTNRSNVNGYGSTQQQAAQTASRVAQDPRGAAKSLAPSQGTQMKLAQIIGAFQAGKFPSQQQIDAWVDYLAQSGLLNEGSYGRTGALSDEGAAVVSDLKRVLKLLKRIGDEKNGEWTVLKRVGGKPTRATSAS